MEDLPQPIQQALAFEQLNFTKGPCSTEPFYEAPEESLKAAPGTLLKVEKETDTSGYLIPPATALSRIVYQSRSLNGSAVPVSAFILWPYSALAHSDGLPVIAWAHGTSGIHVDCAPSHHKNLWQHFLAPYQLVLRGYVVVATDYAGLGVSQHFSGQPIVHEYLASPAHANDVVYAVEASQAAFPELSKDFAVIGHSQGGGAAWAVAQRQVHQPVPSYLGAVAVSPVTTVLDEPGELAPILGLAICPSIAATCPEFEIATVLTQEGLQILNTVQALGAGISSAIGLFVGAMQAGASLLKPDWKTNEYIQKFQSTVQTGGRQIGGPLLVIHGESDPRLSASVTTKAVERTIEAYPSSQLSYARLPGVTHTPALPASQALWMDWIADRFGRVKVDEKYQALEIVTTRPAGSYHPEQNWYLEAATEFYHAP